MPTKNKKNAKSNSKTIQKPEVKKMVKTEVKKTVKPEVKKAVKPEAKKVVKPEVKKLVKPEVKKLVKPEVKKLVKPEVKKLVKPEIKKEIPQSKTVNSSQMIKSKIDKTNEKKSIEVKKTVPKTIGKIIQKTTPKTPEKNTSKPVQKLPIKNVNVSKPNTNSLPKSAEVKSTKNQEIKKNDILVAPSKENKPIIQIKKDQIKQNIKAVKLPDTLKKKKVESHKQIKPIKIPKLTTTNIKPYKGTYEPIIGREVKVENTLTNDRYNDAELNEFAQLINSKLETAQKTLLVYQNYMTHKDEMGDDMESGRYLTVEDSTVEAERERVAKLAFEQKKFIDHLKSALIRIENKTYGICRITGKLIPKERLFHVPHATLTVEAKNQINNK